MDETLSSSKRRGLAKSKPDDKPCLTIFALFIIAVLMAFYMMAVGIYELARNKFYIRHLVDSYRARDSIRIYPTRRLDKLPLHHQFLGVIGFFVVVLLTAVHMLAMKIYEPVRKWLRQDTHASTRSQALAGVDQFTANEAIDALEAEIDNTDPHSVSPSSGQRRQYTPREQKG